jgi:LCP family protein required for cell wall assembly
MQLTVPEERPRWKGVLKWCLYGLLLFVMAAGGTFFGAVKSSPLTMGVIKGFFKPPKPDETFGREDITVLLLGADEDRAPGGKTVDRSAARSDMIMVARLHFADKKITGITIPRDTLASVPGYSTRRINAFHSVGGPDLARKAVESLIGVKIDRIVVVDYAVFQDMVNMIGGIDIDVEKRLKYNDDRGNLHINLEPGPQHLDGYNAMCYVRYRHDSDFDRQRRQRQFLVSFKDQALHHFASLTSLADQVGPLTRNAFSNDELVALLYFAKEVGSANIKLGMLPVLDANNYDLMVNTSKLYGTLKEYELIDE